MSTVSTVATADADWFLGSARALQRDQIGVYLHALRTYGDHVRFRVGPPRVGFVFDAVFHPVGAHQVLASRTHRYVKDAPVFTAVRHLLGNGVFTAEGERWRRHRRILQPLFTPRHVAGSLPQINRVAAEFLAQWRAELPHGGAVDLADTGIRFTLQALSRTVFGGDAASDAEPVVRSALPVLNDYLTRRALAPVPVPRWLPTPANVRAERTRRVMFAFVDQMIRRRRDSPGSDDLLSLLLAATDPETGDGLDAEQIRDEVLLLLFGGFETTATAVALTLDLLARHADVQERVRDEVFDVLGDREPQADDLKRLTYTAAVIQEELRLYPSVHTIVRRAADDTELMGEPVPAGRIVAVSVVGIHRNRSVWPDPGRFLPDRFIGADRDRFAHLPFGAGPRSCMGSHLATAELTVAVAAVVRAYRLEPLVDAPTLEAAITLHPGGSLPCWLSPLRR